VLVGGMQSPVYKHSLSVGLGTINFATQRNVMKKFCSEKSGEVVLPVRR